LLPASLSCRVLITARRMLTSLDSVTHLRLGVLAEDDAVSLLRRLIRDERPQAHPQAAEEIVRLCGYLPLAVRIAAARLIAHPGLSLPAFAARLAIQEHRLSELQADDRMMRDRFMTSYRDLDAERSRMFRLLSLLAGDITVTAAAALADRSEVEAADSLGQLAEIQLLDRTAEDQYRMPELLRLFARERVHQEETEEERALAVERVRRCVGAPLNR
jgi:hypothetical protein